MTDKNVVRLLNLRRHVRKLLDPAGQAEVVAMLDEMDQIVDGLVSGYVRR